MVLGGARGVGDMVQVAEPIGKVDGAKLRLIPLELPETVPLIELDVTPVPVLGTVWLMTKVNVSEKVAEALPEIVNSPTFA